MLEKIDIHITDHCNLNCKGCTHFSPLAEEFYLDIDDFERDLTRLSELSKGQLGEMFLLGGEPLLHPELIDFFPIARNLFPNTKIVVISNGILMNSQDDRFWKACKRYNIQLWISDYALQMDYKIMEGKAREFGVFLGYTSTKKDAENKKLWAKYKIDPQGQQYWIDSFEHCAVKNCATLKNGKLYTCCTMAHIDHFNKYFNQNLEVSEFDYVDIYKVDSYKAILDTLVKPVPFCRYCKPKEYEQCYWEPSKKDINEWI